MLWPGQVVILAIKICKKCGESKPLESFCMDKSRAEGHSSSCKVCWNSISKAWQKANPEKVRAATRKRRLENLDKVRAAYRKWAKANPEKVRANNMAWRKANPEKARAKVRKWQKANPEMARAAVRKWRLVNLGEARAAEKKWKKDNSEKVSATARKWRKANPEKCNEKNRKRDAAKLRAVPKWSETELIKIVYERASAMGFDVDHVIPLRSKVVCGLHVWSNLQLLSQSENGKKGNRFWPDMWGQQESAK